VIWLGREATPKDDLACTPEGPNTASIRYNAPSMTKGGRAKLGVALTRPSSFTTPPTRSRLPRLPVQGGQNVDVRQLCMVARLLRRYIRADFAGVPVTICRHRPLTGHILKPSTFAHIAKRPDGRGAATGKVMPRAASRFSAVSGRSYWFMKLFQLFAIALMAGGHGHGGGDASGTNFGGIGCSGCGTRSPKAGQAGWEYRRAE